MDRVKNTVGINSFVKRQIKGSGKTYSLLSFNEIASHAQHQLSKGIFKEGYRKGVLLIPVNKDIITKFICPIVKIMPNTKLESKVKKRRENENVYISTKALNGEPLEIGNVDLILYRYDVLDETNECETDNEWELIAFQAIPKSIENLPMGPITMMRNQLELPGGTKAHYKSEEWANSVLFWQKYALLKSKEIE